MPDVYVSIGNSDDKLTQKEWSHFVCATENTIETHATKWHGRWQTASDSAWQGACWAFEIKSPRVRALRMRLAKLAGAFGQDSIAWAEAQTEFIEGLPPDA